MTVFHNLAFYKFVAVNDVPSTAAAFRTLTSTLDMKGTLIFAREGLNGYVAATPESAEKFIAFCQQDARFADIEFKVSLSDFNPYRRMLVKEKNEIVTMGCPGIEPEHFTGEHLDSRTLKEWLDSNEDVILLDTRNTYETKLGSFKTAVIPEIETFRTFPKWVEDNFSDKKNKKIVTFCTGGIRCEKATAYMRQAGFEHVYQIQGGILKYFDQVKDLAGDNHYSGDCFVFDHRVAVNPSLQKTEHDMCFVCWATVTAEDKAQPTYKENEHCPHCYEETIQKNKAQKEKAERTNREALARRFLRVEAERAKWATRSTSKMQSFSVAKGINSQAGESCSQSRMTSP